MNKSRIIVTVLSAIALTACASSYDHGSRDAGAPARMQSGMLVGSNGMTLYIFDKDPAGSGKSVCNGPCAGNWPPLYAGDHDRASGDWGIATRDDGRKQWAYKGKPLYFWIKDQKPGDASGEGFNGVWHIAR